MPRPANLSKLSVGVLLKMRDNIGAALKTKADLLKKELAILGTDNFGEVGRITMRGSSARKSLKGITVAPKYRGLNGETWAGRGAMPVWMRDAIKGGKKQTDFLIDKSAMPPWKARKKTFAAKKVKRCRPRKKGA